MMTKIIPVTDFVRRFGEYADMLATIDKLILTRDGRPFAEVKMIPEEKNKKLLEFFGLWKGTTLDSDTLWKSVRTRKNRKKIVKL